MANPAPLKVHSQVVQEGRPIPMSAVHTSAGGDNISPDLAWDAPPTGTRSLAVTCYDPERAHHRGLQPLDPLQSLSRDARAP